jgi:hypothetical protein
MNTPEEQKNPAATVSSAWATDEKKAGNPAFLSGNQLSSLLFFLRWRPAVF